MKIKRIVAMLMTIIVLGAVFAPACFAEEQITSTSYNTSWENFPTQKKGDHNYNLRYTMLIQLVLNKYMGAGLTVDGVFGTETKTAVMNYQSYKTLTADGIVGPNTWTSLRTCVIENSLYPYSIPQENELSTVTTYTDYKILDRYCVIYTTGLLRRENNNHNSWQLRKTTSSSWLDICVLSSD